MPEPETTHLELTGGASFFSGDIDVQGLTLTSPGPGKVIWPDGTEVSAEQFQDSVTAATIAYEKGLAAGRQAEGWVSSEDVQTVIDQIADATQAIVNRAEAAEAKVARVEALASGLQEQYEASDYSETASLGEMVKAIRTALAEPERDEEPEEIHHCDGCGEDYNILAESHVGHQIERDPAVTTWDEIRKQREG